jgi:hypothetical protein
MIDLMNLEENKVSVDLNGYSMVFEGETGDGKTYSVNKFLREIAPEGKVPLFIMLEDRYKAIPNIMAIRVYSVPDMISVYNQLNNPVIRNKFSCVVIDTADKLEELNNRYIANQKDVKITEDIGYGRGKRYLNGRMGIIADIRNLGLPVHFIAQLYKKSDINTGKTTYQTKLNDVTKAQIFHDAFLVGRIYMDNKSKDPLNSDRMISFKKTSEFVELKDGFGLPPQMYMGDLKKNLEAVFENKFDASQLTQDKVLEEVAIDTVEDFKKIIARGNELGQKLFENGYGNDATHVLKVNLSLGEDDMKTLSDLVPSQIDVAKVVVMQLEDLVKNYNL